MHLQLDLFGPVRAWRGNDEIVLGSAQRRTLLAILAFQANQVVTRSDLIDAIWGENAPASANGSIYTYVSSLRSALDPTRTLRDATALLASSGPGYCLRVEAEAIDVARFENLRERARLCLRGQDVTGALAALDNALGLFQDEPMAGLSGPYAETQRERLKELRLEVVERRAKILLDVGEHQKVLTELTPVAAEHPVREGLQSLHLLALYRCGRRDEALGAFERLRSTTIDELGVEPGTDLTARYEQIRADDPALWHGQATAPQVTATARTPRSELREPLVGRQCELATIRTAVRRLGEGVGCSVWLEGEPGVGKSALLNAGLAQVEACTVAIACADQLEQHDPLQVVLDCLDIKLTSADHRRREVARAARTIAADDEAGTAAVIDLVVELVGNLCRERPLILVMDDLQWADPASLEAWRRLAAEADRLPLLLIGVSMRVPSDHRLTALRARTTSTNTHVHSLAPLSPQEIHALLAELTGADPSPALLELARGAAGNPLFVRDLVNALDGNESPETTTTEGRPVFPQPALETIGRRLGFLSAAASELLRWAALLDRFFTRADLAAALGRPVTELDHVVAEVEAVGLVTRTRGKLTFRHPVVRESLYARTPTAIRLALHRQLAEALADVGAPVERVAFQLLAAPIPVDKWFCTWLAREVYQLAPRAPLATMRLLQRVNTSGAVPSALRETLGIATARIKLWLERDLTADAGQVAARTKDPEVLAEMRWLLAFSRVLRGNPAQAVEGVQEALGDEDLPSAWRSLNEALLTRARTGGRPGEGKPAVESRPPLIPPQRTMPALDPAESYWFGRWDAPQKDLTRRLRSGMTLARHTLDRSPVLRRLSGVAAVIAAHRGRPDDARTHLMSVWALAPGGEFGQDGTDFMLGANAMLAEAENQQAVAFNLLSGLLEFDDEAVCPWLPGLVRIAVELGQYEDAELATSLCERTAGYQADALRCRAILVEDPMPAFEAAGYLRTAGNRFGEAKAMEDAAALLVRQGKTVKGEAALRVALNGYDELGALADIRRAKQRFARGRERACR
ncbi:BTAD domain-containing putative transcriptional regulator [Amycolatopsis decaplanina]|uniref:SARP family transcriptional regulator n=1 Tax=Amycolatopsis decaplanina DSM 44594 TaxID=1284240 RepID=M2Y0C1_9PSEU|nr:BTAD domain-containing putative transcriptional regulator [Amycolatopsis decaplanina]EME54975.1 SARP family transcriptional regulator [Amycolatopsis decaplanina DSM 44594]